jgi:signal peptidase II
MLSVLAVVVAADAATKALVVARLPEGTATSGAVGGARLRHVANRRLPWGSAGAVRGLTVAWLAVVAAGCTIASVVDSAAAHAAVGAVLGGATGNLIDAVRRRAITDFIDLRVWPVFNVADAAIVLGALALAWHTLRGA